MRSSSQGNMQIMKQAQAGVTLIELLTVMVVLGILASIAIPSYRAYLIRSQRSDAMTALLSLQTAEEKHYLQNNQYTSDITSAPTAAPPGLGLLDTSAHGLYTLSVVPTADLQGYTATATPVSGKGQQDDTKCMNLTLTDTGVKGVSGTDDVANCWR